MLRWTWKGKGIRCVLADEVPIDMVMLSLTESAALCLVCLPEVGQAQPSGKEGKAVDSCGLRGGCAGNMERSGLRISQIHTPKANSFVCGHSLGPTTHSLEGVCFT
jgi:hypothetical protein